jgi:hypothetical protein
MGRDGRLTIWPNPNENENENQSQQMLVLKALTLDERGV